MMIVEYMSKLNPESYQSTDDIDNRVFPHDLSASLGMGMLPRDAYLLGMIKFAGFKEVYTELYHLVLGWSVNNRKNINNKKKDLYIEDIAMVALDNSISFWTCKMCKGYGYTGEIKKCTKCKGSGEIKPSDSKVAREIGIPRQTFIDTYKNEYSTIIDYLDSMIIMLDLHIKKYYLRD